MKYYLYLLFLFIFACAESDNKPASPPAPPPVVVTPPPPPGPVVLLKDEKSFLHYMIVPLETMGTYGIEFSWKKQSSSEFEVVDVTTDDPKSVVKSADLESRTMSPAYIHSEHRIFEVYDNSNSHTLLSRFLVTLPKDLIIEGPVSLEKIDIKNLSRLYLLKNSKIITGGQPLNLLVNELISDDGVIENFPKDQVAVLGKNGRTPMAIEIRAQTARGHLTLVLRGEKGGEGNRATSCTTRGLKGPAGENAVYIPKDTAIPTYSCARKPGNGGNGGAGGQGYMGQAGFAGGDSGTANIEIYEATAFKIDYEKAAGDGGNGGEGGPGCPGGLGGDPGENKYPGGSPLFKTCTDALPGREGMTGPQGPTGPVGLDGKLTQVCEKLGFTNKKYCR